MLSYLPPGHHTLLGPQELHLQTHCKPYATQVKSFLQNGLPLSKTGRSLTSAFQALTLAVPGHEGAMAKPKAKAKAIKRDASSAVDAPSAMPSKRKRRVTKRVTLKTEATTGSSQDTMDHIGLTENLLLPADKELSVKQEIEIKQEGLTGSGPLLFEEAQQKPKKKKRNYANAYAKKGEGLAAAIESVTPGRELTTKAEGPAAEAAPCKKGPKRKRTKAASSEDTTAALKEEADLATKTPEKESKKKPRKRKPKKVEKAEGLEGTAEEILTAAAEAEAAAEAVVDAPKRRRRPKVDPDAFQIPTVELLDEAGKLVLAERPVPNLGFACLNATLRAQRPPIFTNRDCIKKTWEAFGLEKISQLALDNCTNLAGLIHWNHVNGIRFFRMSSKIFPWCTEWELKQLPAMEEIKEKLAFAGNLARAFDQRLTFHPSHFVKLGCEDGPLLDRSLKELEMHSLIFDLMGYEPSHVNKINIHIGGQYGDKAATMQRFAKNFKRLSPNTQKRLTVENDDIPSAYSITDLMWLHEETGIPLVFDFHHHKFCPGGLTEEEAFKKALTTWPQGIRPVVHWSESQEGRKPHAHSDFVAGPLRLYGLEKDVDVMIESKAKELALLRLRDPEFRPTAAALAAAITTD